jgi:hypothetical protein
MNWHIGIFKFTNNYTTHHQILLSMIKPRMMWWTGHITRMRDEKYCHTYVCEHRRGLDWRLNLLTTYRLLTTSNYNTITNLHTSQITTAHAKPSQSASTSHFPVTDLNNGDSDQRPEKHTRKNLMFIFFLWTGLSNDPSNSSSHFLCDLKWTELPSDQIPEGVFPWLWIPSNFIYF